MIQAALDKVRADRRPDRGPGARLRASRTTSTAATWPAGSRSSSAGTTLPATTVNRFCASSDADRADGLPRDQVRRGRHLRQRRGRVRVAVQELRLRRGRSTRARSTRSSPTRSQRTEKYAETNDTWHDPRAGRADPGHLHRDGPDRGERRDAARHQPRRDQDEFGVRSQNLAEKAIATASSTREITPVTLPDGTVVSTDDGPRAGTTLEKRRPAEAGVPAGRHGHGRQLLPAERRRRGAS